VYGDFVKTVCFLGAESSGKSTITQAAATAYQTEFVDEYGRTLWEEKKGALVWEDMIKIAQHHISSEDHQRGRAFQYLFVDTSPLTTLFYSQTLFGRVDKIIADLSNREYDYYFLCDIDIPYHQDGTRQDIDFRNRQHKWYLTELRQRKILYTLLQGSVRERFETLSKTLCCKGL
jgi:NadR type nicotinamide-nucleotide adenylyltransferase